MAEFTAIENRDDLVELYHLCFPDNVREEKVVHEILYYEPDRPFGIYADGRLLGACLVHGRAITMLAVRPEVRGRGYGARLLQEGERRIRESGAHKLTIGVGTDDMYLMPGVPMDKNADAFFRKRGYHHTWGDTECLDMKEDLAEFQYDTCRVGDTINGITYRWATTADLEGIRACVDDAQASFTPYYMEPAHYAENTRTPVLCAVRDGQILGTLIVSLETEGAGRGSVGCTATRTDARGQGIATNMVRLGTRYLKDAGMQEAFLGYTYTEIVPMYARSGYRISQKYFMAEKEL